MDYWNNIDFKAVELLVKNYTNDNCAVELSKIFNINKDIKVTLTFDHLNNIPMIGNNVPLLEIYLSPSWAKKNIEICEKIYNEKPRDLPEWIIINKYMPFNSSKQIKGNFELRCNTTFCVDNEKVKVNLIIFVPDIYRDMFKEEKIVVVNEKKIVIKEYIPVNNQIYIILHELIGEFHFLNTIGYLKFVMESDGYKKEGFDDLVNIREKFIKIEKSYFCCKHCKKLSLQADIINGYCSKYCLINYIEK